MRRIYAALLMGMVLLTGAGAKDLPVGGLPVGGLPVGGLPVGGLTAAELTEWLQKSGYQAQAGATQDGTQYVKSAAEGLNFGIFLYGCTKGRCTSMQFVTSFTGGAKSPQAANEWNRNFRWVRAYIDGDKDLIFDFDVDLSPGVTYEGLADLFDIWCKSIPDMRRSAR